MGKRASWKGTSATTSASRSFLSPPPFPSSSSKPFANFDLTFAATSSKKTLTPIPFLLSSPSAPHQTLATISDLKSQASSHSDSLKRHLDLGHSETLKEFDSSHTRIAKRFKIQTQACLQLSEEIEKEYKKISDRINENTELMKASYAELITEVQATASRVCKISIPELAQSMEKAIEGLRSRYKIPAAPV
ncbi:uncharacterized protein LOC103716670 isoform X1 [Phoenix dactylifera]|uniref:Uncharacterized protein LOC103716670 isoform X1 n=1 Tax=Phoenix dactylifera TaxID=42345 RepID=A0A8B7CNH6_PHODC|nr:uncharacterized protein LOC103716670 isoform X1 [Phoenix dactylifera]XP_038982879.1 uncharacterized protein LOC103716670 isoform X1 [Phoenix dactylifera]